MHNPLKFTDPSGYRYLPTLDLTGEDKKRGGGSYLYFPGEVPGNEYNYVAGYGNGADVVNPYSFNNWWNAYMYTSGKGYTGGLSNFQQQYFNPDAWNNDKLTLENHYWTQNSETRNSEFYKVSTKHTTFVTISLNGNSFGQGNLDIKDWIQIGLGSAGTYFDVKGNALHNDLYWKGKTIDKIYFKNPLSKKTKVGWKANSFKATGKAFQGAKSLGTKFGVAGLILTGTDVFFGDGLTTSNVLDAAFGIAGFIPGIGWAISGTYFVVNTGVLLYTGKSIGENIDE